MADPIPVDFNRRDSEDLLVASLRRITEVPNVGDVVAVVDDEENRALARVVRADERSLYLDPIWTTFATADEPRIVPSIATFRIVQSWSTATSMNAWTTVSIAAVEANSGPARREPVPA